MKPPEPSEAIALGRVSLGLWVALLLVGVGVVGLYAVLSPSRVRLEPPEQRFVDRSADWGLMFEHNNGAAGDGLLPETMGSGVAVLDFDNDGRQDVLFVNSTYWPWEDVAGLEPTTIALFRSAGEGRFEEVTAAVGLDVSLYGMGVAVGDYDNDGWVDVFLTAVGENRLFRNVGGERFEEVTARAGVAGADNEWSASAAWVDVDGDGLLDLFVCNYVRWSREVGIELAFKLAGIGRGYGPSVSFTGANSRLYLNNGDGTLRDVSEQSGIWQMDAETGYAKGRSLAVAPIDLDGDGRLDLVVANHNQESYVFRNLGDGRFEEVGEAYRKTGAAGDGERRSRSIGIDAVRQADENWVGLTVGSFANELSGLSYEAGDSLLFAEDAVVGGAAESLQRFGVFFFDYDLDGRQDLLTVNGYLEEEINTIELGDDFRRSARLYWNSGRAAGGRFVAVRSERVGEDIGLPIIGRGAAFGDLDGDGALDVVMTQNGGRALALRNEASAGRSWARIKLVGTRSNRDAIGATVELKVGTRLLRGTVMPTRSYLSQSELPVTFGLGRATRTRGATVYWPDGTRQVVDAVRLGETTVVVQE